MTSVLRSNPAGREGRTRSKKTSSGTWVAKPAGVINALRDEYSEDVEDNEEEGIAITYDKRNRLWEWQEDRPQMSQNVNGSCEQYSNSAVPPTWLVTAKY